MTADEFENPDSSPLPPYDRDWRHPAEVANSERAQHLGIAPPLGRRLTALTVIASLLTSVAVLAVAIPKGIEEYAQVDQDAATTTTLARVKGAVASSLAVLRASTGTTTALSLGNQTWLVATESIAKQPSSTVSTSSFEVLREDKRLGLSVIRISGAETIPPIDIGDVDEELTIDELRHCHIIDAFQTHTLASEPSLSSQQMDHSHPVNMETAVKGLAVAVNKAGKIVGVIVRKGHAQWAVSRDALLSLAKS